MEKRYDLQVQLTPKIHNGEMAHYWHIDLIDGNGRYAIADGWNKNLAMALADAHLKIGFLGLR